jgi:outer membrane protein assembly factor BamB
MIRIRTGTSWRDDPRIAASLGRAAQTARAAAARALVDALTIEVDGVDLAAGLAEAPLVPSLEELLRAISRILGGATHAAVVLGDGGMELLLRRRGPSALITVVALGRPSLVLARDVEVDLEALAAAALEAAAQFCRDLAALVPGAEHGARALQDAARELDQTEPAPERQASGLGPQASVRIARAPAAATERPDPGRVGCLLEIADDEGVLAAYEGGRPDLGSLLVPGRVVVLAEGGAEAFAIPGYPFLALRDLVAASDRALSAARRGDPVAEMPLARPGRSGLLSLRLELAAGRTEVDGQGVACAPLALVRALAEAALDLGRVARARNPCQAENAHLTELESAAAERIAELDELEAGDLARRDPAAPARPPAAPRVPQGPLGPGRLRRLSFRRTGAVDVGTPAGDGLAMHGRWILAAGRDALAALDRGTGSVAWRSSGCSFAAFLPGAVLAARGDRLIAYAATTGRPRWDRSLSGGPPTGAAAFGGGTYALVEPGVVTGLDPRSGATLWSFAPPGAARLWAAAFGGVLAVASDAGFVYGVDAEGRLAWRVRSPGPLLRAPQPGAGACVALAAVGSGAALLAVDPASGVRRWEAPLDLVPAGPVVAWGRRLAVPGTVAGDPAVSVVDRCGTVAWTAAPPLAGAPAVSPAGGLLVIRDGAGALLALDRAGAPRWSRPAHGGRALGRPAAPAVARGTLVVAASDGISCLDAATGELLGVLPGVAAVRMIVDRELGIAALDPDGIASAFRLGTHLSVV